MNLYLWSMSFSVVAVIAVAAHADGVAGGKAPPPAPAVASSPAGSDPALAKDIEYMVAQGAKWNRASISRNTLLGWTAGNAAVIRSFECESAATGGRGEYCEIQICVVKPAPSVMDCGSGHMFSVGIGDKAVAADLAKQVSAAIAKVGPLTAGTTLKPASVKVSVVKGAVRVRTRTNSTPLEVIAPFDDGANTVRATGAKISSVSESPDKTCTAAIGVAMMRAQTQKTETSPRAFGAVVCQAANAQ